jgi:hypothetical protein
MLVVCVIDQNINTLILVLFIDSVNGHTSTSREIMFVYSENHMEPVLTLCGHDEGLLNVKAVITHT